MKTGSHGKWSVSLDDWINSNHVQPNADIIHYRHITDMILQEWEATNRWDIRKVKGSHSSLVHSLCPGKDGHIHFPCEKIILLFSFDTHNFLLRIDWLLTLLFGCLPLICIQVYEFTVAREKIFRHKPSPCLSSISGVPQNVLTNHWQSYVIDKQLSMRLQFNAIAERDSLVWWGTGKERENIDWIREAILLLLFQYAFSKDYWKT